MKEYGKIKSVKVVYENVTLEIEGEEAVKWCENTKAVGMSAYVHGVNPFETNKVNWKETWVKKEIK